MELLKIKNETDSSADLYLYGDICDKAWSWEDVTPNDLKDLLEQLKGKNLNIYINSNGGDVFAGMAIHNMLKRHEGKKTGYVDGVAASIASVILMACDEIVLPKNAWVMIHRPVAYVSGNADEVLKAAETLEGIEQSIAETYLTHSSLSKEILVQKMSEETWLSGEDIATIFDKGVIIQNALDAVACATELTYKKMPKIDNDANEKMMIDIALALN